MLAQAQRVGRRRMCRRGGCGLRLGGVSFSRCPRPSSVARWFTEGWTLVRRELHRRPLDQRPPIYEPDLFRARFTFSCGGGSSQLHPPGPGAAVRCSSTAANRLRRAPGTLPVLRSRRPRGRQPSAGTVRRLLRYRPDPRIPPSDTIIAWGEEILAYHSSRRASNGPIEGINDLHPVLRDVAHGFTNTNSSAARGLLVT